MDQAVRNKLRNVVTRCRKLLEDATAQALEGRFGISGKKGKVQVEDESRMGHLVEADRACRQDLLDHLEHIKAIGYSPREALDQLIREIAFTHLNRLCAYKMMEGRGLIREAVSRGLKSQGFFFYLADHPEDEKLHKGGQQDAAYRNYLDWLGGTLSQEIGVLFNPNDPANRIYPPQRLLEELLGLINSDDLSEIWVQDETIGWVYQYFTPKELRDQARRESPAPRNSYELAFRNQFFTPRYVVEFLTDNTLGRTWYEMRRGETTLKERCRYLVRRPTEIFLKEGGKPPDAAKEPGDDLSQEELLKQPVYIPHRHKKDPRTIKVLDPACGSGHFLLYCFDLLQVIYEEAYDDPDLAMALRKDYPALDDLRRAVPGLILKYNLHGIDIDLRATQIAALALWLRCQRAYQELGLKNGEQPKITRSNIVCAEPMPGETDLLTEFTATLQPTVLGQLVEVIFEQMKIAGEAGSLLKIEEEIKEAAQRAKGEYIAWKKHQEKVKETLFPELVPREHLNLFDFTDLTDEAFLDRAEEEIVTALLKYAEHIANGRAFRRRLFAEDAARGFAFVDLCRKKYDVVLMNPPFGEANEKTVDLIRRSFLDWNGNLLCAFISRAGQLATGGHTGVVYDRTANIKNTYENFRKRYFLSTNSSLQTVVDLGWEVLDANVEVSAGVVCNSRTSGQALTWGCDLTKADKTGREEHLQEAIPPKSSPYAKTVPTHTLLSLPNSVIGYYFDDFLIRMFDRFLSLEESQIKVFNGHTIKSDEYFRYWWEPRCSGLTGKCPIWARMYNGGSYSRYYSPETDIVYYGKGGSLIKNHPSTIFRNLGLQQQPGIAFGKRGEFIDAHILRRGFVSTVEGQACAVGSIEHAFIGLAILNSLVFQYGINAYCGQHKYPGYVNLFPMPDISNPHLKDAAAQCRELIETKSACSIYDETVPVFVSALGDFKSIAGFVSQISNQATRISVMHKEINEKCFAAYQLTAAEVNTIRDYGKTEPEDRIWYDDHASPKEQVVVQRIVSYCIGCALGRWDIRIALDSSLAPKLPSPFDLLPACPPGMLVGPDGLPAEPSRIVSEEWLRAHPVEITPASEGSVQNPSIRDIDYPIRIDWDGILVDDPEHEDDIVRRLREVLEVIWKDQAEAIEQEACDILSVHELRDYFRKPGNGGFWMDHVKRYSKSRRKAPIYWYLRSSKGNYGLWLYYHRLGKDLLFKALLNYVDPKIRLEEDRLKTLRRRKEAAGSSGQEAKQLERDLDRQDQLMSELHDFKDKFRRAADLHLTPDLNDGVILNIAPLWELVLWKEAQKYWDELIEGKYEWSSIGKQLREKGLVR